MKTAAYTLGGAALGLAAGALVVKYGNWSGGAREEVIGSVIPVRDAG